MKKLFALLLCLMMVLPMASLAEEKVDITLWTYPIGNWTNAETVDAIIATCESARSTTIPRRW